jgi:dihydroorotate dehydrogenase
MMSAAGPGFRLLDPEVTHNLGILAAKMGLFPREDRPDPTVLKTTVWSKHFKNPIG